MVNSAQLFPQTQVLGCQTAMLQNVLHQPQHLFFRKRLDQIIVGSQLDGLDRIIDGAEGGHHDHRQLRAELFDLFQDLDTIHVRHAHILQQQVHPGPGRRFQQRQQIFAAVEGIYLIPFQLLFQVAQDSFFIITDTDMRHGVPP